MSNEESITSDGYEYYAAAFPDAFVMLDENQGRLLARALKLGAAEGWEPDDVKARRLTRYAHCSAMGAGSSSQRSRC